MDDTETYAEIILKMLDSAISYETLLTECKIINDDYDRIQAVCEYMEKIIKDVKEHPDPRTKQIGVALK